MKKRGRPTGTRKAFSKDPDRYLIALIDALLIASPGTAFEHAAMLALYFHQDGRTSLANPLQAVRRLGLPAALQGLLSQGWILQQLGDDQPSRDTIGGQVDRLRKKFARIAGDPAATRWRHYMGLAWASLLTAPSLGVIEPAIRQVGERRYFETVMLPLAQKIVPSI